jgi:hypothetical protein
LRSFQQLEVELLVADEVSSELHLAEVLRELSKDMVQHASLGCR